MNGSFSVLLGESIGSRLTSRWRVNQPGDTLCYVSPARCAVSSLTSAKRITRLILRALRYASKGMQKLPGLNVAVEDVSRLSQKF